MADDESEGESENEVTYWDERAGEDENYLGDGAFRVEQVRGRRRGRSGGIEYLIKWEGYASEENTWEPVENVSDDLIAEKEATHASLPPRKRPQGGASSAQAPAAKGLARGGASAASTQGRPVAKPAKVEQKRERLGGDEGATKKTPP
ncbi:hypothetical protein EMIHUDRAFT_194308 [Emiliania huxleyi CCMP1516]|uniref:Chromo domain-containing protein n=2 Tax=Emiliania huxleyi TaxID=2903 RepID=A0A0D3L1A4_EMIH1|nr:hypothetical protein EMIHUDRAFT_194308 [Emiliania huxleyi CCMP1516]EOD41789.1 hypothetical protein EMIHUDRAFT_194308 [Emiliania huxleyi CCMP1516]|eukprot:XP_005794218.1 hypothetical protein EMIHUDRAFT_194308 [Emiliania huxleyi CCMP1516]